MIAFFYSVHVTETERREFYREQNRSFMEEEAKWAKIIQPPEVNESDKTREIMTLYSTYIYGNVTNIEVRYNSSYTGLVTFADGEQYWLAFSERSFLDLGWELNRKHKIRLDQYKEYRGRREIQNIEIIN